MKKLFLFFAAICLVITTFGQNTKLMPKYDERLYEVLPQSEISMLEMESPSKVLDINFDLIYFCYIDNTLPEGVHVLGDYCNFIALDRTCDDAAKLVSTRKINHTKYQFPQEKSEYNAFSIGNTGYYVIVYPIEVYMQKKAAAMKTYGF